MGVRSLVAAMVLGLFAVTAHAGPKEDIQRKTKEAMENYDLMDYAASKKSLEAALQLAKKHKLDKDLVTAKVYLALGIAAFADGDQDGAKAAFSSAVAIDPKIQIDAAYKSPELNKLLDGARSGASSNGNGSVEPAGGSECAGVKGLQHTIIDTAPGLKAQPIEVLVGGDVTSQKIGLFYRVEGTTDFVEGKLAKHGECKYTGEIPAGAMKGGLIHYYVAALNENGKAVASRGSSGSPNIIEITAPVKGAKIEVNDNEDPINGNKKKKQVAVTNNNEGEVSGGVIAGGKPAKVYIQAVGGTGFGYVTGKTEFNNPVENCCIGNSLVVITPELGYNASRQLSIGLAARIGLPIGANIDDPMKGKSSTMAPAVLLRARYALSKSGEGLRVMGQLGGGILRNTIKLKESVDGMDTDIVGQGPLLVGAGIGYMKRLGGKVSFVGDLSVLGAIAVVDKLGNAPNLGNGLGADLSVGLSVGF